jgi:hypothetical protein
MQINTVQKRPANLGHVFFNLLRATFARVSAISQIPTRTWIHARYKHKLSRKSGRPQGTGNCHSTFFQRLSQHLKAAAVEFWQLIEKKHAVVRHADFAW